jgi:hypothetical protein
MLLQACLQPAGIVTPRPHALRRVAALRKCIDAQSPSIVVREARTRGPQKLLKSLMLNTKPGMAQALQNCPQVVSHLGNARAPATASLLTGFFYEEGNLR